jgi:hypothetical protein
MGPHDRRCLALFVRPDTRKYLSLVIDPKLAPMNASWRHTAEDIV